MMTTCPKCHYERQSSDHNIHPGLCPNCGIAYQKWHARQHKHPIYAPSKPESGINGLESEVYSLWDQIKEAMIFVPERVDPVTFWGRSITLVLFTLWGLSFVVGGLEWSSIGGSFMHNINLPFHEFGHVLFMPFGRFMMILGGSLFQVLMPLGIMVAFIIQRRDTFAASIMLWWSGQNLIDISPYIADAPYRAIPLIRGMSEDAHDWGNLLSMMGMLDQAQTLARLSFTFGSVLMLVALGWGGYILSLQKKQLDKP